MTSKNSLLTYHDGKLAQIAAIYGDYLVDSQSEIEG